MKKLVVFLLLLSTSSFGQIIIDQSVVEPGPHKVGDVITIQYTVETGGLDVNYLWFRYHYSNKHLEMVTNSTVFTQGNSTQTYYQHWNNYIFNPVSSIGVGDLLNQYKSSWNYTPDSNWNVGQLSVQRTDASISGVIATQKYLIKDNTAFQYIHRLHIATATARNNATINNIGSKVLWMSLNNVSRLVSSTKFRVVSPGGGYNISAHKIQVYTTNGQGTVDWSTNPIPIYVGNLDNTGEVVTDVLKKGIQYYVMVTPNSSDPTLRDYIITVSDAYRAFLAINDKGINGTNNILTTNLENKMANVTLDNTFDSQDAYYIFAKVMGIDLSSVQGLMLPTTGITSPVKFFSGFTSTFSNLSTSPVFTPINDTEVYDLSFAWAGDLNFSHSSPLVISTAKNLTAKVIQANTSIDTSLKNGKVEVNVSTNALDVAGMQYQIGFDDTKIELENVIFDTGNTITNFSTKKNNIITFGSIDKVGTERVKSGVPYKLIFKPKINLTNTSGLIFTYFAEAVNGKGEKINLNIQ